jgi:hypothetical protein
MSENKKIYPEGIRTFKPHEKAPDFVLGSMIITLNDLIKFCKDNPDLLTEYKGNKQLKCKLLNGKYGVNIEVDTWKPEKREDNTTKVDEFNDVDDLLPF